MRVSQRTDHVMRALVRLAQAGDGERIPAGEVARALELPRRQVEQEFSRLARAGILECRRGASGGCQLARPADQITVKEVAGVLEGELLDVPGAESSATHAMWLELRALLVRHLDGLTLAGLATDQDAIDAGSTPMYYI